MYMVAPVRGIPVLAQGDDVCAVISSSLNMLEWPDGGRSLWGDDIVVIAGKIIAKAQGRYTRRDEEIAERFEEFGPLLVRRISHAEYSPTKSGTAAEAGRDAGGRLLTSRCRSDLWACGVAASLCLALFCRSLFFCGRVA